MRRWSRHPLRTVRANRSANAFARGERTGERIVSTPIEAKTSLKLAVNLASRSRMRKPRAVTVDVREARCPEASHMPHPMMILHHF
jgi:hypothetical protein